MAFVVCEPCTDCKYTDCVVVCPMECFYEDESMLYIDPDSCIDCEACLTECPVAAIFRDSDVPAHWQSYTRLNLEKTRSLIAGGMGPVTEKRPAREGAGCKKV